ncbi:MAG TPA: type II toxin-antitoxin system VapC family toxin [Vicinamibacteria bacterium]|nr:type II toxin-antitoxin system VapC family toxin [Vicinamibacteria bacterium]
MRLLLDTHAFLWWCTDDPRLGEIERRAIRNGANEVLLSAASVWEMAIKQALGRLRVPEAPSLAVERLGIGRLAVAFEHAEATASLPPLHCDPFDRLLVAQARVEGLTLVTRDPSIRSYPSVAFLPA